MLNDEETDGLNDEDAEKAAAARKARRTRGGELYDAFAGESDEEDNFERYTDRTQNQQAGSSSERLPGERGGDQFALGGDEDDSDDDESHNEKPKTPKPAQPAP
jgi:kexin